MANKKVIPKAADFLLFPRRLKTENIIHKNIIETTEIITPIEKTLFTLVRLLNTNKYGIINTLKDIKLTTIPLLPNKMLGKVITHAKKWS